MKRIMLIIQIMCLMLLLSACAGGFDGKSQSNSEPPPDVFFGDTIIEITEHGMVFYKSYLYNFSWAPDSQRMAGSIEDINRGDNAYSGSSDDIVVGSEIYMWDIERNQYQKISAGNFSDEKINASWNPKNDLILYKALGSDEFIKSSLGYVDLSTSEYVGVTYSGIGDWFPDGERFITGRFETLDIEANVLDTISMLVDQFKQSSLIDLSPDGNHLVFKAKEIGEEIFSPSDINLYSFETEENVRLLNETIWDLSWSSDSEWFTFSSHPNKLKNIVFVQSYNILNQCFTDSLKLPKAIDGIEGELILNDSFAWSPNGELFAVGVELEDVGEGILLIDTDSDVIEDWLSSGTCGD